MSLDRKFEAEIEEALLRLKSSEELVKSPALQKILDYVVFQELDGKGESIKAFSIGIDALNKPTSFDPQVDPSVRVNFGRLRQNITSYYQNEGKYDSVRIEIPKGTYRPSFVPNDDSIATQTITQLAKPQGSLYIPGWLYSKFLLALLAIVMCGAALYFYTVPSEQTKSFVGGSNDNAIGVAIVEMDRVTAGDVEQLKLDEYIQELRIAFSRNRTLRVVSLSEQSQGNETDTNQNVVDFSVKVMVRKSLANQRLLVELLNAHTKEIVWARAYDLSPDEEIIADKVTRELYAQIFGASQKSLEGRDPQTLTARQLFVMSTWFPGPSQNSLAWEKERLELARMAVTKDPSFGPAYSVVADKLSYLASVDAPSDTKEADDQASTSRLRALELAPSDANTVFNVAQSYWHSGRLNDAIRTMRRVLELDPNNALARYFLIVIPYTCFAAPDNVLNEAVKFDKSLNKDNPIRWVTLTWLGWLHLNRSEFELALEAEIQAAQIFQIPYTVMRHAVILNQLYREEDAAKLLMEQKQNWPNLDPKHFSERTIPKLCNDSTLSDEMRKYYDDLTASMQ